MRSRALVTLVSVFVVVLGVSHSMAAPAPVVQRGAHGDAIDWSRGLILAVGAAAADLRAPSPEVARVAAERRAMEQARERLRAQALGLSMRGATVAGHVDADAAALARLDAAVQSARAVDLTYGSDGSVVATAALPLEQVRQAVAGVPPARAEAGDGATAVIVDARKVLSGPALGLDIATPAGSGAAPTVFYRTTRAALSDPRLGERVLRARAARLVNAPDGPRLELEADHAAAEPRRGSAGSVTRALETGALVVIVIGKGV